MSLMSAMKDLMKQKLRTSLKVDKKIAKETKEETSEMEENCHKQHERLKNILGMPKKTLFLYDILSITLYPSHKL